MSKIVDYLIQQGAVAPGPDPIAASFTVNTAAAYVTATYDGAYEIYEHYLSDGDGKNLFRSFDSFYIVSVGIVFPHVFQPYSNSIGLSFGYNQEAEGGAVNSGIPGIGGGVNLAIPFGNYEIPVGIMCNPLSLQMTAPMQIGAKITEIDGTALRISMEGISSSLDGNSYEVAAFMKITHNTGLVD